MHMHILGILSIRRTLKIAIFLLQRELRTAIAYLLNAKNEASIPVIHLNLPQKHGREHGQQREATPALF